jgi:hypothetical protein
MKIKVVIITVFCILFNNFAAYGMDIRSSGTLKPELEASVFQTIFIVELPFMAVNEILKDSGLLPQVKHSPKKANNTDNNEKRKAGMAVINIASEKTGPDYGSGKGLLREALFSNCVLYRDNLCLMSALRMRSFCCISVLVYLQEYFAILLESNLPAEVIAAGDLRPIAI